MRGVCSCGAGGTVVKVDSVWLCAGLRKTIRSAYPSCLMCLMYLCMYVNTYLTSYRHLASMGWHRTGGLVVDWSVGVGIGEHWR